MEPRIVERKAFSVVGLHHRGKAGGSEIPQLWQSLGPRVPEIKNLVYPSVAYGVCDNMDTSTGEFDYVAGFEVSTPVEVPEGMVACDVQGGKYAVVACTLPTLEQAYTHIYKMWLPQSGFEGTGGTDFEMYGNEFDAQNPASEFEIYIPIG